MIQAMSNPPVIVGHGIGGLFTQLLLKRDWQEIADHVSGWLTRHPVPQSA